MKKENTDITPKTFKILAIQLHQAQPLANESGIFNGASSTSFSSAKVDGRPSYALDPHPMGVKVRASDADNFGVIVCSANIKAISYIEK